MGAALVRAGSGVHPAVDVAVHAGEGDVDGGGGSEREREGLFARGVGPRFREGKDVDGSRRRRGRRRRRRWRRRRRRSGRRDDGGEEGHGSRVAGAVGDGVGDGVGRLDRHRGERAARDPGPREERDARRLPRQGVGVGRGASGRGGEHGVDDAGGRQPEVGEARQGQRRRRRRNDGGEEGHGSRVAGAVGDAVGDGVGRLGRHRGERSARDPGSREEGDSRRLARQAVGVGRGASGRGGEHGVDDAGGRQPEVGNARQGQRLPGGDRRRSGQEREEQSWQGAKAFQGPRLHGWIRR